ncbi:MAG: right-handed parallel beta-helix repeat-containing protein [Myxococcota bacterium]
MSELKSRNYLFIIALLFVALTYSPPVSATTYYVANSGNNSNSGSSSAPFLTIQRAVSAVGPGDTVVVHGGTYAPVEICDLHGTGSRHDTPDPCPQVITFKSAPGEEAVIDHQAYAGDVGCLPGQGDGYRGLEFQGLNSCLVFDGLTLTNSDPLIDQHRGCDVENNIDHCVDLWRQSVTAKTGIDAFNGKNAIKINVVDNGEVRQRSSHITLKNLHIYHHALTAIGGGADYSQLLDSKVHDIGSIGEGYGTYLHGKGWLIRGNEFYNNNGVGMRFGNTTSAKHYLTDSVIENNRIYNNASSYVVHPNTSTYRLGISNGINFWGVHRNIFRNNLIYGNGQIGILLRGSDNILANNTLYNNGTRKTYEDVFDNYSGQRNFFYNNLGAPRSSRSGLLLNPDSIDKNNRFDIKPNFVDAASGDFRLDASSTVIDAGMAIDEVKNDFLGVLRPQGKGYDIGAFEYGGTPPVVVDLPPSEIDPLCDAQSERDCWHYYVEAETQKITALKTAASNDASGASYLDSAAANEGQIEFAIEAPETGDYIIWARVLAPEAAADSFFVSANGGAEDIYDAAEGTWSEQWQWTRVNGRDGGAPLTLNPRIFTLDAGANTVNFRIREAGVGIDVILVTNDVDYIPQGVPCAEGVIQGGTCSSACLSQVEICDDGKDNDCDGDVDDADANCQVLGCTPGNEVCDDGLDNDCDGAIDADDTSCQQGVCPENHIVVNPDGENSDEFVVIVHDKDGNPVRCARIDAALESFGCSGAGRETGLGVLFLLGILRRRRPRASPK